MLVNQPAIEPVLVTGAAMQPVEAISGKPQPDVFVHFRRGERGAISGTISYKHWIFQQQHQPSRDEPQLRRRGRDDRPGDDLRLHPGLRPGRGLPVTARLAPVRPDDPVRFWEQNGSG